jgi:hypothetical protein
MFKGEKIAVAVFEIVLKADLLYKDFKTYLRL